MFLADAPMPGWIHDIKAEARGKIIASRFAAGCRQGDIGTMQALVLGLWPFVDAFPKILIRGASQVPRGGLVQNRELLNTLLHRGREVLVGIRKDEENHRKLWIETGQALGLSYPVDFQRAVLPETQAWIETLNKESGLFTLFVRFAAVEIIAETVSIEFLASDAFTAALGNKGVEWFRVHAEHTPGMTHEQLELHLAFAFLPGEPRKEDVSSIILDVVDHFVLAAEASVGIIQ